MTARVSRTGYTAESVERALDAHIGKGLIRGWRYEPTPNGTGVRYEIGLSGGDAIRLRSTREAYVFAMALSSAAQAHEFERDEV